MPKNKKGQLYYHVTHDKPEGLSHVLLLGGSVGTVLSFFIVSVAGALSGTEMNDLVLYFILSAIVGFFIGAFLTWLFVRHFASVVSASSILTQTTIDSSPAPAAQAAPGPMTESPAVANEEDKGQSVDFVFPELSPDK